MKRRTPHAWAACVISLTATTAMAADPEAIDKPVVKPGMSWRVVVSDVLTKAPISDNTYTVASVSDSEVVVSDAAGDQALVLDAAHYAIKSLEGRGFQPPMQRLRFPLTVGSRWESAYRYDNPACGAMDTKLAFKVTGWEDVTTPAGKFRALRVDSQGGWRCGAGAGQIAHKQWIVADLPVPLKHELLVNSVGRISRYEVHEVQSFTKP